MDLTACSGCEVSPSDHGLTGLLRSLTQKPAAFSRPNAETHPDLLRERGLVSAQLCDLPLHARTDRGEGHAEFLRTAPANHRAFNGERVAFILRKDRTLQHDSNGDGHGTCDATAPRGEVSQLSLTSHHLTSR